MSDNNAPPRRGSVPRREASHRKPDADELPVLASIMNNIIELDPDKWFKKRYDDITQAASDLPVVLEYINESHQRASISAQQAKWDVEAMEGETYTALRQEWATRFNEKMTEDALKHAMNMDEDLKKARNNYAVLRSYVGRLASMQDNLRAKLDALRSVEATRRRLIDDDPNDR